MRLEMREGIAIIDIIAKIKDIFFRKFKYSSKPIP